MYRKLLRNLWKAYNRGKWKREIIRESQAISNSRAGLNAEGDFKFINQLRIDKKTYTLTFQEFRTRIEDGGIVVNYEQQTDPSSKRKKSRKIKTLRFTKTVNIGN